MEEIKGREGQIIEERKKKLAELKKEGINPYLHRFDLHEQRVHSIDVLAKYERLKNEEESKDKVIVAGRIMSLRSFGKLSFAKLQDVKGFIQLVFQDGKTTDESIAIFKKIDSEKNEQVDLKTSSFYKSIKEKIDYHMYGFNKMFIIFKDTEQKYRFNLILDSSITKFNDDSVTGNMLKELWKKTSFTDDICIVDFTKRYKDDNQPVCLIGKSIFDHNGNKNGVLALQIPLNAINKIMLEDSKEIKDGLLGLSFLSKFHFTLDQAGQRLILKKLE